MIVAVLQSLLDAVTPSLLVKAVIPAWVAFIFWIRDPVLMFFTIMTATILLFPHWPATMAVMMVYGMLNIAMKNDLVTGTHSTTVSSVADAMITAFDGTFTMALVLWALAPFYSAVMKFDLKGAVDDLSHAAPLLSLLIARYVVENEILSSLGDQVTHLTEQVRDFMRMFKAFVAEG